MIKRPVWIPILFFVVMILHGSWIGLTDDEAYYWVLAQKPSLGYAYHPPMVAWLIALSETIFGWIFSRPHSFVVRLPALASAAGFLALSLFWLRRTGVAQKRLPRASVVLLSFAGIFSLSWMMVPDLSLFLGWTLAFVGTWTLCFDEKESRWPYAALFVGTSLAILSKYSGVLAAGSAGLSLLIWSRKPFKGIAAIVFGGVIALAPIVWWNANHEWVSILYQVRERHSGSAFSWIRYGRFWAIELLAAGPVLVFFAFALLKGAVTEKNREALRVFRFTAVWLLPGALIFCLQPLWAEFKPHWAFIVWWPALLALTWASSVLKWREKLVRFQIAYGVTLSVFVLVSCHFPLGGWALSVFSGPSADPRLDVTNDLYGWDRLPDFVNEKVGSAEFAVVGSRYQTAAQAAFAFGRKAPVTMLPRDLKARDEWPDLDLSDRPGPEWPVLKRPVIFVADNRYDAPPEFPKAHCSKLGKLEARRSGFVVKWISVWKCEPGV